MNQQQQQQTSRSQPPPPTSTSGAAVPGPSAATPQPSAATPQPSAAAPQPSAAQVAAIARQQFQQAEVLYQSQLEQLHAMGFTNRQANLRGKCQLTTCRLVPGLPQLQRSHLTRCVNVYLGKQRGGGGPGGEKGLNNLEVLSSSVCLHWGPKRL